MTTAIAILLGTHVLLPLLFIGWLWFPRSKDIASWLARSFYGGAYIMFLSICGQWDWLSEHLRLGLPIAYGLAVVASGVSKTGRPWLDPTGRSFLRDNGLSGLMTLVFLGLSVKALAGYGYDGQPIDLAFPMASGAYLVRQGGDDPLINHHNPHKTQRYALDIVGVNPAGRRADGLMPADPGDYTIFGRDVLSPCTGFVMSVTDGRADNRPPAREQSHPAGNNVVLACGNAFVQLAHLREGSTRIREGTVIREGQPIGEVGNSGNSTEPHLHIYAYRGMSLTTDDRAAPVTFSGRFLVRGSTVTVP